MKIKRVIFGYIVFVLFLLLSLALFGCNSNNTASTGFTLILISLPGDGGTIQQSPLPNPDGKYTPGTRVRLEARSSTEYIFVRWSGDAIGTMSSITITMDKDKSITGEFSKNSPSVTSSVPARTLPSSPIQAASVSAVPLKTSDPRPVQTMITSKYNLISLVVPQSSGTVSPSTGSYLANEKVNVTASANFPYIFARWSGADNNDANPTVVGMNSEKLLTAYFTKMVPGPQVQKTDTIYNGFHTIPIELDQFEWIQGEINAGTFPGVAVYIEDQTGQTVKDFGSLGHTQFVFMAQLPGKYSIIIKANYFYSANYTVTYTIYKLK